MAARLRTRLFRRLDAVAPNGSGARRLLDVGAGSGDLGGVLAHHGWDVVGVEPSAQACALARERGVDARQGTLETVDLSGCELRRRGLPPQPRARRRPAGGAASRAPRAAAGRSGGDRRAQLRLATAAAARGGLVGARPAAPPLPLHPRGPAPGAGAGRLRPRLAAPDGERARAGRQRPAAALRAAWRCPARASSPATGWRSPPIRRSGVASEARGSGEFLCAIGVRR